MRSAPPYHVTDMRGQTSIDEPFGWWGPVWEAPAPRSLADLVRQEVLTAEAAAYLAELVALGASLIVAAGPSGAGKTTVLTALLDFLPSGTQRVYVRGSYEPFDFLQTSDPARTALLVNEISGHLPIYLWGAGVRRVFTAARLGYQLCATAHATSVEDFVHALAGYPLRIPAEDLRAVDLLVILDAWPTASGIRRMVYSIVSLSSPGLHREITPVQIALLNRDDDRLEVVAAAAGELVARLGGNADHVADAVTRRIAELTGG